MAKTSALSPVDVELDGNQKRDEKVAQAAGVAAPQTPEEASSFTAAEVTSLRGLLRGERIVAPPLRKELDGHLGGQSVY